MKFFIEAVEESAINFLNSCVASSCEDADNGWDVTCPNDFGLMVESFGWKNQLQLDPSEVQWGRVVVCACPVFTVEVTHHNGFWTVGKSHLSEMGTCYVTRPTHRDYSGEYPCFDLLPSEVKWGLRQLALNNGTGVHWCDRGLASVVRAIPDNKGWRPVRTQTGRLVSVLTPSGRTVRGKKMLRKVPRHLRKEMADIWARDRDRREEQSSHTPGMPYSFDRDTRSWDRSTYDPR